MNLLEIQRGSIVAPAGCGKTHLIAEALLQYTGIKPVLVLTHTNAGVAALRIRLTRLNVPARRYRLSTIDGWAMRLVGTFPTRAGIDPAILTLTNPGRDYPAIKEGSARLLAGAHVDDCLRATYAHLLVDEYQDCSVVQHTLIANAARALPTCVLGDPMQAVFGFARSDPLADWNSDVCAVFPVVSTLDRPWRWENVGQARFGAWLLDVRENLRLGREIDLRSAPENVTWFQSNYADEHTLRLRACATKAGFGGKVLIIGDEKDTAGQRRFASQTFGAVVVENVDMKDLVAFAQDLDLTSSECVDHIVTFAGSVMSGVGAPEMLVRLKSLKRGTARKDASDAERAAIRFSEAPSYSYAAELLSEISRQTGVRAHRDAILKGAFGVLNACRTLDITPHDAAVRWREKARAIGREVPDRAVGSTLLLKGLESDVAVILHPEKMAPPHLYVAMTRGAKQLIICSKQPVLNKQ